VLIIFSMGLFISMGFQEQYYSCIEEDTNNSFLIRGPPIFSADDLQHTSLIRRYLGCGGTQVIFFILMYVACAGQNVATEM